MRGIEITEFGGPETLAVTDLPEPVPAPGQAVCDVLTAGINYADLHQVSDTYLAKQQLPLIPGMEALVRGPDGGRYLALPGRGGYAERVAVDPAALIPVPDGVSAGAALSVPVQGATAYHLLHTCAHLAPGETVVVHAGAGGTGSAAIQLARRAGAGRIIATASTEAKRKLTLELGADVAVDARSGDLTAALREANGGRKVDVVLEMTGGEVFDRSLAALAPFGRRVYFGAASGRAPQPLQPNALMPTGRAVIGFWLVHVMSRPEWYAKTVVELLGLVAAGELTPVLGESFPLERAADAHRALAERGTVGKLVLDVQD